MQGWMQICSKVRPYVQNGPVGLKCKYRVLAITWFKNALKTCRSENKRSTNRVVLQERHFQGAELQLEKAQNCEDCTCLGNALISLPQTEVLMHSSEINSIPFQCKHLARPQHQPASQVKKHNNFVFVFSQHLPSTSMLKTSAFAVNGTNHGLVHHLTV